MVSGGSDSMALLALASQVHPSSNLSVLTLDHGLRDEAWSECQRVEAVSEGFGIDCTAERLEVSRVGNLSANARKARYAAAKHWSEGRKISRVCTGHTRTDLAETFLMRLARGSGVDGLSAMAFETDFRSTRLMRPLLEFSRSELRTYLSGQELDWIEDPSNDDDSYERVKFRKASTVLSDLGLTEDRLVMTAHAMTQARAVLDRLEMDLRRKIAKVHPIGCISFDAELLSKSEPEMQYRLLSSAMGWITGEVYRPRLKALQGTLDQVLRGRSATLQGCLIETWSGRVWIMREPSAVTGLTANVFDHRWIVPQGDEIVTISRKILPSLGNWRDHDVPRTAWLSLPARLRNGDLHSYPLQGTSDSQEFCLVRTVESYTARISTH